jgi:trimeric autotransporter adhesin
MKYRNRRGFGFLFDFPFTSLITPHQRATSRRRSLARKATFAMGITSAAIGLVIAPSVYAATLADLLPQNVTVTPSAVTAGGTITVSYTVKNQGGTNAPASHTKIQIKNSSNVQITAPVFSTSAISANSSVNESHTVTIPSGSAAGSYNAYVIVDNNSEVTQSNTSNDFSAAVPFTVQAAATPADLLPQNITVTPSTVSAGGTITVSYTVKNQGGTNAPASHTKIQIKNPSNVQVTAPVFSTLAINANSSVNESHTVTIPSGSAAGTYNAYVIVDNNSEVTQSNTSNDFSAAVPFTVQAAATLADLLPQNVTVTPSTVTAGGTITVSYTVKNQGGTNAPASHTKIQIKNPSNVEVLAPVFSTSAVNANSSVNESHTVTIASGSVAGTYNAYVIVDNNSEVTQSNTSNDYGAAVPFTVQSAATQADLLPQNVTVTPSTVTAGGTITVSYTVKNQGGTNAPASHTKIQIKNPSNVEVAAPVFSTSAINANSSVNESHTVTIASGSIAGTYDAYVIVDNNSEVTQSNTSNDYGAAVPFAVQSTATPADLLPQNVAVTPSTVAVGSTVTVSYTVRNQGGTNAPASHTKIQIKNPSNVEVVALVFSTAAISANSSINESHTVTIPSGSAAGTYNAYLIVDNNSEVTQSNTSNDYGAAVSFTVQSTATPADLLPQNVTVTPSTVVAGSTITMSYTVRNQGGTNAPASHTKIQVKNSSNVQVAAPVFSTAAIGANSSVNESHAVTIPSGLAAGTYNAYVIVDNSSEVTQSNTNNDYATAVPFTVQAEVTPPTTLPDHFSFSAIPSQDVMQAIPSCRIRGQYHCPRPLVPSGRSP